MVFKKKNGALQTQRSHQVSLYVLWLHPPFKVVDGIKCLILDENQL